MAFSQKAIEFLDENYVRDSREWFKEHKDDYSRFVTEPFSQLVSFLEPVMMEIDENLICTPKCISRLYRDARYAKGKTIFRDEIWCSIRRKRQPFESVPEFYFYISTRGFGYGCGYYCVPAELMNEMREMIISSDVAFKKAEKAVDSEDKFVLTGEMYKRNHFPEQSEKLCNWLNRKAISVSVDGTNPELLFSERLCEVVKEDFKKLAPVYEFYKKAEKRVAEKSIKPKNTK